MSLEIDGLYENLDEVNKRLKIIEAVISDTRGTRFDNPIETRMTDLEKRVQAIAVMLYEEAKVAIEPPTPSDKD